ncbi:hypothetical protein RCL_jg25887.t1 [Rhizophagus clarus]|uniref:Uncharacterized protein n=1 Tax=Rhizophagus clarus TaxID=94130 RepID=A0A8H3LTW5_9GLOM|nr:hypothetical protein RCL_jg25887.t1 [Rhizophagus clarus]
MFTFLPKLNIQEAEICPKKKQKGIINNVLESKKESPLHSTYIPTEIWYQKKAEVCVSKEKKKKENVSNILKSKKGLSHSTTIFTFLLKPNIQEAKVHVPKEKTRKGTLITFPIF